MRKTLSLLLAFLLIVSVPQQSFAQTSLGFTDIPDNWSTEALHAAVNNGLLKGHNSMLRPNDDITRAEAVTIVNRSFGATKLQDISSFTDVNSTDWFYDEMAKATAMRVLMGSNGKLNPNDSITREEVFTLLSRALNLSESSSDLKFLDLNEISVWAKEGIFGLINLGYINGSNGYIHPGKNITRAEFAQIMHNIIKNYITSPGIVESIQDGNVMINTPGVTLKGVTVKGDLIIGDGVGQGEVTLEDVNVSGRLLVRGGGENSILIKGNSRIQHITVTKIDGIVRIFNETGEELEFIEVDGEADVIIEGKFKDIVINSPDLIIYAKAADIKSVEIKGENSKLIVDEDSKIKSISIDAKDAVIEGKGEVVEVDVTENGSGSTILTPDTIIEVDKDADDVTGTGGETIKPNTTYENGATVNEDAKPVEEVSGGGSSGGSSGGGTPPPAVVRYNINYSVVGSNGTLNASVGNGTTVATGTQVTFTATPIPGFEIKEWKVNGSVVTSGSTLTRTISANTTVTVEFKEIVVEPTMYTVTYSVIGEGGTLIASVPNGGTAQEGSSVNFTATPDEGYRVKAWSVNDAVIDWLVGNNVSRDMIGDVDFKVEFELINPEPTSYSLTYLVFGIGGILESTVGSGMEVEPNTELTFTATPDRGYVIKEWKVNGEVVEAENTLTTIITADTMITVEFEAVYSITYSVIGTGGILEATVYSEDSVPAGSEVTFTATPDNGYEIKEWRYNGNIVEPGDNILMISDIGMDTNVTVEFQPMPTYELTIYVGNVTSPTVTVKDSLNNIRPITETISGNIFIYNLEAGSYTVTVEKDGYHTETINFAIPATSYAEVYMVEDVPDIVSVNNPPVIELNVGQDLPALPSTVDVVLDTEAVVTLDVVWNTDGFDKFSPESYVLGGTLTLTGDIENPLGLVALQVVDVFGPPEIELEITNSNTLRFNFINTPAVWFGEKEIMDVGTPEYTTLAFLQDLFNDPTLDASVLNEENIRFNYGPWFFEIELLDDAITDYLFWELDHPRGMYGGNGDGIYRKDVVADLSIFNNHLGLASESTAEPFKLKFSVPYEYGIPNYDAPIVGAWQTAEQRDLEIDPTRTMPTYTATIDNSNVLRIDSNQPIFFEGEPMGGKVNKATLLAALFGTGEDPGDLSNKFVEDYIEIITEDTAFEIHLLPGSFDSDFFWNLDHPDGVDPGYELNPYPFDGDGNGVYRKEVSLDLSWFYNSSGDWQESEIIPLWLKLYVPFENGIGNYDEPVQAIWQTIEQSELDVDPVMDTTPPEFGSFSVYPEAVDGFVWVDEGELIEFQISATDSNLRRINIAQDAPWSVYGHWYYADSDVYNGPTDADKTAEINEGIAVTYADGTWTFNLGPNLSAGIPSLDFVLDFEDYAGNSWTDVEPAPWNRTFSFTFGRLDKGVLNEIKEDIAALIPEDYTQYSWDMLMDAMTYPESTQEEIDDKVVALSTALDNLVLYVDVTSVTINDKYSFLTIGERYNLEAIITPSNATNPNVIWSIIEGPGQIDHTGELIANDEGLIVVRATSEDDSEIYGELAFTGVYNQPPVPYEGTEEVQSGSTILIDVIALSSDPDGDTLSILGYDQPNHGTLMQEGDSLRYEPFIGFIGNDSIMYSITDGESNSVGTIEITVTPPGEYIGSRFYDSHIIGFYNLSGYLYAVLEGQESTEAWLLTDTYTSTMDIIGMSDNVTIIYMSEGQVRIAEIYADGTNAALAGAWTIESNDGGSLTNIQYLVDSNEVIHFVYFDTMGESGHYTELPDLMYFNTLDANKELLNAGYIDDNGGSNWTRQWVSDVVPAITIDNYDNIAIMYVIHNSWSAPGWTDHVYTLSLMNPNTLASVTLEQYGVNSLKFSGLSLSGGSDIEANYIYDSVPYTRYFDGATLNEIL